MQAFTLVSANGCDSIVQVTVTAWPALTSSQTLNACPGGSADYNGTPVPVGSTQAFTLVSANGCDSTVTVSVQPWPTYNGTMSTSVCPGEVFVYQGVSLSAGTTQTFTLMSVNGCDSLVTVQVAGLDASGRCLTTTAHRCCRAAAKISCTPRRRAAIPQWW
jgi:hypothetical protein